MQTKFAEIDRFLNEQLLKYDVSCLRHIKDSSRAKSRLISSLIEQNKVLKMNFYSIRKRERLIRKNYTKIKDMASFLECERNQLEERLNIIKNILKEKDVKSVKAKLKSFDINFSPIRMSNVRKTPVKTRQSAGSILDEDNFSDPGNEKIRFSTNGGENKDLEQYFDVIGDVVVSFPHVAEEKKIRFDDLDFLSNNSNSYHSQTEKIDNQYLHFTRLNRPHEFESKSALKVDHCGLCGKRIDFGKTFLRCVQCSTKIHVSCKSPRLQPCLNLRGEGGCLNSSILSNSDLNSSDLDGMEKRTSGHTLVKIDLSSLCPEYESPCIPAIIILCIHEISERGMDQLGLYRLSGSDKMTKELFEKLLIGKYPPNMALISDVNIICGCLKMFLRRLETPLIPPEQRSEFEKLLQKSLGQEELYMAIDSAFGNMPRSNRDTLAYLLLHLQAVSQSPRCQMNSENIARIFGPTLVGHNSPEEKICQMMEENYLQQKIVKMLLEVPEDFYQRFLIQSPPRKQHSHMNLINKQPQTVAGFRRKNSYRNRGINNASPSCKTPSRGVYESNQNFSTLPTPMSFNRSRRLFSSFKQKNRH